MIQFNLLPDVKKEYIKARKTKRLIFSLSTLLSVGSIGVVALLFGAVQITQIGHIERLSKDIREETTSIQETKDLTTMLTVQNQLSALPALHESKPKTSRLFTYVTFISPQNLSVQTLNLSVTDTTLTMEGSADSIATINRFVDNIKATRFATAEDSTERKQTFTNVSTELSGSNDRASFRVSATYDPIIFQNTASVTMFLGDQFVVPDQAEAGGN